MAWVDVARQTLGGQADAVIRQLNVVNPNYDWTNFIYTAAQQLQDKFRDGGWQDPSRGSSAGITRQVLQNVIAADPGSAGWVQPQIDGLLSQQQQQDKDILATQNPADEDGFGSLGNLALTLAGSYFGAPWLGSTLGIGSTAAGALAGGLTSGITGGNPLMGAATGGLGGYLSGLEGLSGAPPVDYSAVGGTGGLNDVVSQSYNPGSAAASNSGGMTLNNLPNFNAPTPGYMTPAGDPGSALANATGGVVDAVAPAASGIGASGSALSSGWGTALGALGSATAGGVGGSAGAGLASALGSGVAGAAGAAAQGGYQFPWGNVIGSVIGAAGANSASKDLADAMRYATDKADPFAQERPFYQGQLKSMYTDPNYFSNSPVMKGLVDTSLDQSQRKLASQGYNYSGNTQAELSKLATNESFKYAQNQQDMTAKAAGAYNGPGAAGQVAATGAAGQMGLNNQLYGNLGAGFQSVLNGSQPTAAQQVNGAGSNQSLSDVFKGWSL